jgi:hypothetical protein
MPNVFNSDDRVPDDSHRLSLAMPYPNDQASFACILFRMMLRGSARISVVLPVRCRLYVVSPAAHAEGIGYEIEFARYVGFLHYCRFVCGYPLENAIKLLGRSAMSDGHRTVLDGA